MKHIIEYPYRKAVHIAVKSCNTADHVNTGKTLIAPSWASSPLLPLRILLDWRSSATSCTGHLLFEPHLLLGLFWDVTVTTNINLFFAFDEKLVGLISLKKSEFALNPQRAR